MEKLRKYMVIWLPPALLVLVALVCLFAWPLVEWVSHLYTCPFRAVTGLYCPGCGGTRSMLALLHGHIGEAFHDNPASPLLVLVLVLWYIERAAAVFGKKVRLIPRSLWFWAILVGAHLIWAILRNFIPAMLPLS